MARAYVRSGAVEQCGALSLWSQTLRALREAHGATRDGWAASLGYGRTTVQRWETGESVPDADAETAIIALCNDRGVFQLFNRRSEGGLILTPESLRELLAAARLGSAGQPVQKPVGRRPNLPAALTSFVGRERELMAVPDLLLRTRLVTLTGAGGVGKTRLAVEVGTALLDRYRDGVWLVDLAPLTDPTLVPQMVMAAAGVRGQPGRPEFEALAEALSQKQLLLVLDNCEHLVEACARLAERLLRTCPDLQILATSREVLGVVGETIVRVPSLSVPNAAEAVPLGRLAQYEAVRLFVERVRDREPYFALTDAVVPAVVHICRRLDGIPLALELAAARVPALSVEQLADRLDDAFGLLSDGPRTAPPRHQTLRATLEWSYDLLTEPERMLLGRLSMLSGEWGLDVAEAMARAHQTRDDDVLDLLSRLIDKSLVVVDQEGETRYRLLDTVRRFVAEKLTPDETARIGDLHHDWYLTLAEAEPNLVGPH